MQARLREGQLINRIGLLRAQVEAQDTQIEAQNKVVQGFDTQRIDDARDKAMDRLSSDIKKQVSADLRTLRQQVKGREDGLNAINGELKSLKSTLDLQRQELAQLGAVDQQDWSFAEARYLLRLAHQRLIMTGDVASAEALMDSADGILRELDDASLHAVRGAVASDIAALRAVPRIDTEGLYLKLSALIGQTERLVIFRLEDVEVSVAEGEEQGWQDRLTAGYETSLEKLSSYIVVRRRDVPYEALMDPQWESLVRPNMRMLLEQAQVALLSADQETYRESLRRAAHWAAEFFSADDPATRALVNNMNSLADQVVGIALPDINDSLREIDAAMDSRLRQRNKG